MERCSAGSSGRTPGGEGGPSLPGALAEEGAPGRAHCTPGDLGKGLELAPGGPRRSRWVRWGLRAEEVEPDPCAGGGPGSTGPATQDPRSQGAERTQPLILHSPRDRWGQGGHKTAGTSCSQVPGGGGEDTGQQGHPCPWRPQGTGQHPGRPGSI